jgi:catechol 2,3-dioxygenase-like lactoylglutathione lyase family enzyme
LRVADYPRSKAFYDAVLAPLGLSPQMDYPEACGFGAGGKPVFWVVAGEATTNVHVAFPVADRASVDRWFEAALAAGGADNGGPGLRDYHPNYYAAFVHDPDGNNIEAVCHHPE